MSIAVFLAKRLLLAVLTILGTTVIVFVLLRLAPGDPARIMLGDRAPQSAVDHLRERMGLDQPLPIQLIRYLETLATGDLGTSAAYRQSNLSLILDALPNTVVLALASFVLANLIAVPLGVFAAARAGGKRDNAILGVLLVTQSLPSFWLAILLIFVFSVRLQWFPASGSESWTSIVLPMVTLASFQLAILSRTVRAGMLEVLGENYIRTAASKGASTTRILFRHALPNTLLPVVTILAIQLGGLMGGAYITESVFGWPGVGRLGVQALQHRDYSLALAVVIFSTAMIVAANFLIDVLYPYIDPRVRP